MRMHLSFLLTFLILSWGSAWATPKTFSLDGRLYSKDSSSNPILDSQVTIKVQILNPTEDCVLYEESQVVNTQSTNGYFNIQVGSPVSGGTSSKRTSGDSGNSMSKVFSNSSSSISGKSLANLSNCTYAPVSGDQRYARISATPSSDQVTRVFSPNMTLDSVPNAVIAESAESLQGIAVNQFLQVNNSSAQLTQTNLEALFTGSSYTNLQNILSGSMTQAAGGKVGVGTATPATKLDVSGGIRLGDEPAACSASLSGTFRYNGGSMQFCNSSTWQTLGVSGGGITSFNGQTGVSQTFAAGTAGTAPAIASDGNVHTLNVPLASGGGTVTSGTISNADYVAFNSKQAAGNYVTGLTGDVTATGPGSVAATIANNAVNASKILDGSITTTKALTLNPGINRLVATDGTTGVSLSKVECSTTGEVLSWTTAATGFQCSSISSIYTAPVTTVAGRTGAVTITSSDISDAASANTPSVLVVRDPSGNFSAGAITANLIGNVTGNVTGGTGTTSTLTYKTTTGVGAAGADHIFQVGNNGATEAMRILNNGKVGIGTATPGSALDVKGTGGIRLEGSTSGYSGLQAPATAGSNTWTLPAADGTSGQVLKTDGAGNLGWVSAATGSVTSASVASANGFSGTVATATTTPEITISTTVTGLLKGNGTAISAAVAGTDYISGTLMTTQGDIIYGGASGAGTRLAGNTTTAKQFLTQTGTGAASSAPAWGALVSSDIPDPAGDVTGTYAATVVSKINGVSVTGVGLADNNVLQNTSGGNLGGNNILVTNGTATGVTNIISPASGVFTSSANVPSWSASLSASMGGTGLTSYTTGDLIYASSSSALSKLSASTSGYVLTSNGAGSAPSWQAASGDSTKLPLAGGTMTGALVNNTNSASAALSVTQSGAGYAATIMGGNVGIGTTNPGAKLEVNGGHFLIDNSSPQTRFAKSGSLKWSIGTVDGTTDKLHFFEEAGAGNEGYKMTIDTSGNIGIGTVNPGTSKLRVIGSPTCIG